MPTDPTRAQAVFVAAAEITDPAARAAFVAKACGDDLHLKSRVEALLRAHDQPDSLLDVPLVAPPDADHAATRAFAPDADHAATRTGGGTPGDAEKDQVPLEFLAPATRPDSLGRIGHYEVLQVLGQGAFGIVFRAFDDVLHRIVAVKVLSPQMAATSPARKRFLREARSSAQVRHENVVQAYEVGEHPLPYIVMEFIPGETLQQRLDRTGPVDVAEVVRVGRQIAEGLSAAHANDLIHRDIKPGNILLESGAQRVKITDFGLARTADDASISQSGIIAGTPMYMAPEQAKGETLDQRADLFSLGTVLYQMAAGRPPFRANGTVAVLKRVAEDTPRNIREITPETPQWLCDIIAKLHAKNPDDRFQSAREVADVLADCEAQLKTNGKLKDYSRIPRSKVRRSGKRKWLAAAAVLLPVLAGLTVIVMKSPGLKHLFGGREPGVTASSQAVSFGLPDWGTTVDPQGDCEFSLKGDSLIVEVPGEHNLNPSWQFNNLSAPRVLQVIKGDFQIETRVEALAPLASKNADVFRAYASAGVVLWQDERNFARFERGANGATGRVSIHLEWFRDGEQAYTKFCDIADTPAHLRVSREGNAFRFSYSTDGTTWKEFPLDASVRFAEQLQAGVTVINSTANPLTARFNQFRFHRGNSNDGTPPPAIAPFDAAQARAHQEAWAKYLGVPVESTNSIGMKLRLIPPGKFMMGSSKEEIDRLKEIIPDWFKDYLAGEAPHHEVEITQPFYMGQTEVTVGQFRQFIMATGYKTQAEREGRAQRLFPNWEWKTDSNANWLNPGFEQADNHPVVCVSWNDAVAFCNWLCKQEGKVYQLPTEAEWEYSCRAGSKEFWHFGDNEDDHLNHGISVKNSKAHTWPVTELKGNSWGLYGMHGNAWEWCQDVYDANYYKISPSKNPTGPRVGRSRVLRGGSWSDLPVVCRSAFRNENEPRFCQVNNGFRIMRVISPTASAEPESVVKDKSPPTPIAPFTDAEVQRIAALPAAEQVEEVRKELIRRNPGYDGKFEHKIEDGVVTEIKVVTDKVTDIAPIRVFNGLRVFDCGGTNTGKSNGLLADLKSLEGMNLAGLMDLNLRFTKVTDAGIAYFKGCKDLRHLDLGGTKITDRTLIHFKDCKLTCLYLTGTRVSDAGLVHFQNCEDLRELGLAGTKVSDAGMVYFKDCKNLTNLQLDGTQVSAACLANFKGMSLRYLWIQNTGITDLTPLLGMPLEDIRLSPKNIIKGLDILRDMKTLKTIGTAWDQSWPAAEFWERYDEGEFAQVTSPDRPAAEYVLSVGGTVKIDGEDKEIKAVADLPHEVFELIGVWLQGKKLVTDAGLAKFKDCKNLKDLNLSDTQVSDAGLATFKDCKNLEGLALDRTGVSDTGLAIFKDCKDLTYLNLSYTQVSNVGLAHFKDCKNLTGLHLDTTQVTDAGLADIAGLEQLTELNLAKTKVTAKGVEGLAKALPKCKITWDSGVIEPK